MENEVKAIEKVEKTGFWQKTKPLAQKAGESFVLGAAYGLGGFVVAWGLNKTVEAIQNHKAKKALEEGSEPKKKKGLFGLFGKNKVEKTGQIKEKDEVMEELDDIEERIN